MDSVTTFSDYQQQDVSVPLDKIMARVVIYSLLLMLLPVVVYFLVWGELPLEFGLELLPAFVLMIILHEVIHAVGWKFAGNLRWRDLKFGFSWKGFAPYCHAKAPMPARAYRIGAILPGILTGLLPALAGIALHSGFLTFLGAVLLAGAMGDIYVLWIIRRVPANTLMLDHPSQAGCIILREK